jgi:O-antigen ligase
MPPLDRAGRLAVLAMPLLLLHAPSIAEGSIAVTAFCFLARSVIKRDWLWLATPWLRVAGLWWGWLTLCSLPIPPFGPGGIHSLAEAVAVGRFLIFAAALEYWVLHDSAVRRWLLGVVVAVAVWIAGQCLLQLATGYNLFGEPRGAGGAVLTGPFRKERAGPPLSRIIFPVVVPAAAALLRYRRAALTLAAYVLLLGAVGMMVLIGQRMPLVLTGFGLLVASLLLPRLRPVVVTAGVAGIALLAALPVLSPLTYLRLVLQFTSLLEHFPTSPYGQIYARAWHIAAARPWFGRGFDGFRTGCLLPQYFGPTFGGLQPDWGGAAICTTHPHNFYVQALVEGGFPGLVLFIAAALAWLAPLARGLWRDPAPLRVALFASVLIQLWPIASTNDFVDMPMGGWFFLLLGWGLAEARWGNPLYQTTLKVERDKRLAAEMAGWDVTIANRSEASKASRG